MPTVAEAVAEARRILQDEVAPYRYPEADLVRYVNDAVMVCARMRPDAFVRAAPPTPTMLSTTQIPAGLAFYWTALTEYVAALAERRDDQFSEDGRLVVLLQRFEKALLAGGS